jgi:hypothetical protein
MRDGRALEAVASSLVWSDANPHSFLAVNVLRILHTAWAVVLTAAAGLFVSEVRNWVRITSFALATIYLVASLGIWRDNRWAWRVAVLEPILVCGWCLWWLTWGLYETLKYSTRGYDLSPVMLLVSIYTLPLLLPQLGVIALMWRYRADVLARVRRP